MALEDGAGDVEDLLEAYSDLAAIGTIGDIVPLTGENRTLIRAVLSVFHRATARVCRHFWKMQALQARY